MRVSPIVSAAVITMLAIQLAPADNGIPAKFKGVCLYAPQPEHPTELVRRGVRGSGLFRAIVDQHTGRVTEVKVLRSTPYVILNELAAKALLQWRFQPGAISGFDVPVSFEMSGYTRVLH